MLGMAMRLAEAGHVVLLPDLYYRFGPCEPLVPKELFEGDVAAILGPLVASTGVAQACKDTQAFLAYLDTREDIADGRIGAVGFCMGGGMAIAAAATYPDRFSAVASFHGGNLATDSPASPHLLVPNLAAEVYVASAENDDIYPPAMALRLEDALMTAGVNYHTEIYRGAAHGWMVPDFPVYNPISADRGREAMLALFRQALSGWNSKPDMNRQRILGLDCASTAQPPSLLGRRDHQAGESAQSAPCLHVALAAGRLCHSDGAGSARPCGHGHDHDLHPRLESGRRCRAQPYGFDGTRLTFAPAPNWLQIQLTVLDDSSWPSGVGQRSTSAGRSAAWNRPC
jgi:carboxymethylenebutenolidase